MGDLSIKTVPQFLKNLINCEKFSGMFLGKIKERHFLLLKHNITVMLVFKDSDLYDVEFSKIVSSDDDIPGEVKIVGIESDILLLDSKGNLWQLVCNESNCPFVICDNYNYKWVPYTCIHKGCKFQNINILDITEFGDHFVCAGRKLEKDLIIYKFKPLGPIEICSTKNIKSLDCNLKPLVNVILNRKYSATETNNGVISIIPIKSQNCRLVCYKNGKITAHSDSQIQTVYLAKNITCIEKCFCSDSCLLWSDGVNFHHTALNFCEGRIEITHFEVKCNITGIIAFAKFSSTIFAVSINNVYYHISQDFSNLRKQLIQRPSTILSQIYNESLKLKLYQEKIQKVSEFLHCKEVIQSEHEKIDLKWEGNDLIIKNNTSVTFNKKSWKISLKMTVQGCEWVKVVNLEGNLTTGTMVKVQNPFDNSGRVKVYLVGNCFWEILYFYVGAVGEEIDTRKENLKKVLHEINLHKNPHFVEEQFL